MSEQRCKICENGTMKGSTLHCHHLDHGGYYEPSHAVQDFAKICRHYAEPEPTGFEKAWAEHMEHPLENESLSDVCNDCKIHFHAGFTAGEANVMERLEALRGCGYCAGAIIDKLKGGAK